MGATKITAEGTGATSSKLVFTAPGVQIRQFRTPELGDSTHLMVSHGEGALIDVQRDIDRFRTDIDAQGVRVVAVLDTHIHNDYLSGGPALAHELGVQYVLPDEAGFEPDHRAVRDGDEIAVGSARLRALFTPGHTPHHMSYQVVVGEEVVAVLSGGCVLVGACGRTDLVSAEMTEPLARLQHRSARRIGALPGETGIGPTHGAGSFCAAFGGPAETWTDVAAEWGRNPALLLTESDFVTAQLAGLPAHPAYYRHMGPLNRRGAPGWPSSALASIGPSRVDSLLSEGGVVVDARAATEFAPAHLTGSVNVELGDSFSQYLGWLFPLDTRFAFVVDDPSEAALVLRQCGRIGIDSLEGYLAGGMAAWKASGRPVSTLRVTDLGGLEAAWRARRTILDVRDDSEWRGGHLPGAIHVHVPQIVGRLPELTALAGPVYIHCAAGQRAAIAASLLQGAGVDVVLVDDDLSAWNGRGLPLEK
ncbi:MAG: MBL fold metallo-hydrolase [Candidatus Dormibacteraceae bacterium]